jgi:adenylate cyclase
MKNKIVRGLVVGISVFLLTLILHSLHILRPLERKSWDLRLRLFKDPSRTSQDIALFFIDQESLDVYEQEQGLSWPWPRQIYSAVIRYCMQAEVKALVFDLTFSEGSVYGVEDDEDFAAAIAEAGKVFLPIFLSKAEKEEEHPISLLKEYSLDNIPLPPKAVFPMKSATLPLPGLLLSARGIGNVRFSPDEDGIYRRLPLYFSLENLVLPSLPMAVADYLQGAEKTAEIRLDSSGQMILRFHGPTGSYDSYSIAAVINSYAQMMEGKEPLIPPQSFAGKVVFIGASAPGLYDLRPSPLSSVYPGVEVMATALDNILERDFIRQSAAALVLLLILVLSLLTALGTSLLPKIWQIVLLAGICFLLPAAAAAAAFLAGYWLKFASPELAVLLSFTAASLLNYQFEGRRRRFIKNVFRHYLSPHVIERIIDNPDLLRLGGEKREITSFFSDVAGFTAVSESLPPEDLVNLLNEYLSEMTDIILSFGGTLDKYEGDAIIAFWNAPLDQPDHALRACRAALRCQSRLEELRPRFQKQYGHDLRMRLGLNSDPAVVGNMGSRERFDYTAMGDTVNLASRLEGACRQFKVPILIGEETYERVNEVLATREVDLIRVKGRRRPVRIFEVLGEKESSGSWFAGRVDRSL